MPANWCDTELVRQMSLPALQMSVICQVQVPQVDVVTVGPLLALANVCLGCVVPELYVLSGLAVSPAQQTLHNNVHTVGTLTYNSQEICSSCTPIIACTTLS